MKTVLKYLLDLISVKWYSSSLILLLGYLHIRLHCNIEAQLKLFGI